MLFSGRNRVSPALSLQQSTLIFLFPELQYIDTVRIKLRDWILLSEPLAVWKIVANLLTSTFYVLL